VIAEQRYFAIIGARML